MNNPKKECLNDLIFIYGPPGSGKSTAGKELAESFGMQFIDIDSLIERETSKKIYQIFAEEGETEFRKYEKTIIHSLLRKSNTVIALGGGSLLDQSMRIEVERSGKIITLIGKPDTLYSRLKDDQSIRPLLAGDLRSNLIKLMELRKDHYDSFDVKSFIDNKSMEQVVLELQILIGKFRISGMNHNYEISVDQGCLSSLGAILEAKNFDDTILVVSDENVAPIYLDGVLDSLGDSGFTAHSHIIPAGENYKTIESIINLWNEFSNLKLERNHTVVALGGGVVGDLVGFASATYLRGIKWVNLPTTILSMADASIGGKTGADLPQGKNLIGSFYPPSMILTDPDTLITLPQAEVISGLAEVVKHGIIGDPTLYKYCKNGWEYIQGHLFQILCRAISVKVNIVQLDPYEKNIRAMLNLGHTLGHAVEKASNYRIRHGEAVAIGMVAVSRLAENYFVAPKGISIDIAETLSTIGLPVRLTDELNDEDILNSMGYDKKRSGRSLKLVLPEDIGKAQYGFRLENPQELVNAARYMY